MAGILIIAHTPLATALQDCVAHIYGGLPTRMSALNVGPDSDPAQFVQAARTHLSRLIQGNGALVLTDLFGATPSNIAIQLATLPQVRVITGINLPMLVRAISYRSVALDVLVEKALAGGARGIQLIDAMTTPPTSCIFSSACHSSEHHVTTRDCHH